MIRQQKFEWADNMRVTATAGVILLHIAANSLSRFGSVPDGSWWVANIYNSSVRFCVPLFVMLTGALLLRRDYPLKDFLRKKLIRIVFPFLFWSFIYLERKLIVLPGHSHGWMDSFHYMLVQLRDGKTSYHLWYVYMIIGIYLFIPVIGKWARNSSEKEILYFLALWLVSLLVTQPAVSDLHTEVQLTYFSGFVGYLVLGYYLSTKDFANPRRVCYFSVALILAAILITCIGTYWLSASRKSYASYFHGNFSPNVLMLSIGVFLFFLTCGSIRYPSVRLREFISRYSFGIYLIHVLVIKYMDSPSLKWEVLPPAVGIPVKTFVCLLISATVIAAVNRIPLGKYISG